MCTFTVFSRDSVEECTQLPLSFCLVLLSSWHLKANSLHWHSKTPLDSLSVSQNWPANKKDLFKPHINTGCMHTTLLHTTCCILLTVQYILYVYILLCIVCKFPVRMEAKCQNVHYTTKHTGFNTVSHNAMCKTSNVTNELTAKPTMISFLTRYFTRLT